MKSERLWYNQRMSQAKLLPAAVNQRRFRWRRLVQYRLQTMLIMTAFVAVLFAWIGGISYKAQRQRAAVAALENVGAVVYYDFEQGPHNPDVVLRLWPETALPYWPNWLVRALGIDFFANVHEVKLRNRPITDGEMELLKGMATLHDLDLRKTNVSDAGLEQLEGLRALRLLQLDDSRVTDAGVQRLQTALPDCKIER